MFPGVVCCSPCCVCCNGLCCVCRLCPVLVCVRALSGWAPLEAFRRTRNTSPLFPQQHPLDMQHWWAIIQSRAHNTLYLHAQLPIHMHTSLCSTIYLAVANSCPVDPDGRTRKDSSRYPQVGKKHNILYL